MSQVEAEAVSAWQPNTGEAPYPGEGEPPIDRVRVKLRNGVEPAETWPVSTGRAETTRWSLTGHPFDIVAWRVG